MIEALRPKQWTKNVFVFAAVVFAEQLGDPDALLRSGIAFALFCILSSGVYLINDLADRERDREHPTKRHRPIASGRLEVRTAGVLSVVLLAAGLVGSWLLSPAFAAVTGAYVAINLGYSGGLKHLAMLDVVLVSAGFVLRAVGGGIAIDVPVSAWLLVCTFFLALFLSIGKRRRELTRLGDEAPRHREALRSLDAGFLDDLLLVVTPCAILSYTLYTISSVQPQELVYTVPFVAYGFFRYLYLIRCLGEGDDPTDVLLKDRPLGITIVLWIAAVAVILYGMS